MLAKKYISIILIILFVISGCAKQTTNIFKQKEYNFGEIKEGTIVSKKFYFKNITTKNLRIWVKVSCGCLTYFIKKNIYKPHEKGYILITFNLTGYDTEVSKKIFITTNISKKVTVLTLKANVISKLLISRKILDFGLVKRNKTISTIIEKKGNKIFLINDIVIPKELKGFIFYEIRKINYNKFKLIFTCSPKLWEYRYFSDEIKIKTNETKDIYIPVKGVIHGIIEYNPKNININIWQYDSFSFSIDIFSLKEISIKNIGFFKNKLFNYKIIPLNNFHHYSILIFKNSLNIQKSIKETLTIKILIKDKKVSIKTVKIPILLYKG